MSEIRIPSHIRTKTEYFRSGDYILDGLEANDYLYFLVKGDADVLSFTEDGDIVCLYHYHEGDFFGELELFSKRKIPYPVQAAGDCETVMIEKREVLKWLKEDDEFCLLLLGTMADKILDNSQDRVELRTMKGKQRYLLAMRRHERKGDLSSLTKEELCQETALPLRSLNRIIAQCRESYGYRNGRFFKSPGAQK